MEHVIEEPVILVQVFNRISTIKTEKKPTESNLGDNFMYFNNYLRSFFLTRSFTCQANLVSESGTLDHAEVPRVVELSSSIISSPSRIRRPHQDRAVRHLTPQPHARTPPQPTPPRFLPFLESTGMLPV